MIFDLLESSLKNLFNFCSRRFSLKTMLILANQLFYRLEYIHSRDIIHRDVKSQNILMNCYEQTDYSETKTIKDRLRPSNSNRILLRDRKKY